MNCPACHKEIRDVQAEPADVYVADIKMNFWSMVVFMIKWVLAAIPAAIILFVIGILFNSLVNLILRSL